MTAYRFVHAADVHLDSPLRSLALRDPRLAEFVGNASRQVFSRIVDLCLDEQVSALLLAGDLYDGEQTSMKTARFLAEQLRRLDAADIEVFIIRGNHDALSKITKELVLPKNVHLFGGRADAVEVSRDRGERPIAIHGLSFARPQAPESLLAKYRPRVASAVGRSRSAREGPRRGRRQTRIRSPRRATCRFGRDIDGLEHPTRCRSPAHRSRGPGGGDRQRMDREDRYRLPAARRRFGGERG